MLVDTKAIIQYYPTPSQINKILSENGYYAEFVCSLRGDEDQYILHPLNDKYPIIPGEKGESLEHLLDRLGWLRASDVTNEFRKDLIRSFGTVDNRFFPKEVEEMSESVNIVGEEKIKEIFSLLKSEREEDRVDAVIDYAELIFNSPLSDSQKVYLKHLVNKPEHPESESFRNLHGGISGIFRREPTMPTMQCSFPLKPAERVGIGDELSTKFMTGFKSKVAYYDELPTWSLISRPGTRSQRMINLFLSMIYMTKSVIEDVHLNL